MLKRSYIHEEEVRGRNINMGNTKMESNGHREGES